METERKEMSRKDINTFQRQQSKQNTCEVTVLIFNMQAAY